MERFAEGSSLYLSHGRRTYRLKENYSLLAVHKIHPEDIEIRGRKTCIGFSYGHCHFACADWIPLALDIAILIFVPSYFLFTVASHVITLFMLCL